MPLQQGITPFVITAASIAVGLLIAWIPNRRMDASRADTFVRIGDIIAVLGVVVGSQFRMSEYFHGESHFGRTDTLPGPAAIWMMSCLYLPLRVLVTSYTQYRKDRGNEQLAKKLIKESITNFIALIVIITLVIVLEFLSSGT